MSNDGHDNLSKEPYVPTGLQIGEATDDAGTTLGILTFHMEGGEISFYINEQALNVLEDAVDKLRPWVSKGT